MIDTSFITHIDAIKAQGQSHQLLASIDVANSGTDPVALEGDLATLLSVSISDSTVAGMDPALQYLYQGDRDSQFDLDYAKKAPVLAPGDAATVQVRLINPPGDGGSFILHVGAEQNTVSVGA